MEIIHTDLRRLVSEGNAKLSGHEYRVECPVCKELGHHYEKRKLFIKDDFSVGFCFRCGTKFKNKVDFNNRGDDFVFNISKPPPKVFKEEEKIDTSYYLNSDSYNEVGLSYLKNRRLWLYENYKLIGFKFRNDRLIIPFFKDGNIKKDVVFYQCRFYDSVKSGKRYFIPPSTNKPIYITPNGNNLSDTIILCEGPFGAIAISNTYPEYRCGAVMGSNISDYQIFLLSKMNPKRFVLYFDNEEINKKAQKVLSEKFPFCTFISLNSPFGDPEDDLINGKVPVINFEKEKKLLTDRVINFLSKVKTDNVGTYGKRKNKKHNDSKSCFL